MFENLEKKVFSENYFNPKSFERSGRVYELIGIKYFREMAMIFSNDNYFLKEQNKDGLTEFEKITRKNERHHGKRGIVFFIAGTGFSLLDYNFIGLIMYAGALVDSYCVFLQRYTRTRIRNILDRFKVIL